MKRTIMLILFVLLGCNAPSERISIDFPDYPFYQLPMGSYKVGFRTELIWDDSREFMENEQRPVLIGIWYPAVEQTSQPYLNYRDYLMADYPHDGQPIADSSNRVVERDFREMVTQFWAASDSSLSELLAHKMRAKANLKPQPGRFPLVLYAASFNAGIHENSAIWEFLASHGYVVATIASVGDQAPEMTVDSLGVNAQLQDFNFALEHMKEQPFIDSGNWSAMGFSWGGFTALLSGWQSNANAIITFDGSHSYFANLLNQYRSMLDQKSAAAYLQLNQREANGLEVDTSAYSIVRQTNESFLIRFGDIDHRDFASSFQFYNNIGNDSLFTAGQISRYGSANSLQIKGEGYLKVAQLTLLMLNTYLKGDEQAREQLINLSGHNFLWNKRSF